MKMWSTMTTLLTHILWFISVIGVHSATNQVSEGIGREYFSSAKEALRDLLKTTVQPWCSLMLVTDGSCSSFAIQQVLVEIKPEFGSQVFEIATKQHVTNTTHQQLAYVLGEATRIRKAYKCVVMIVATLNRDFMESLLSLYKRDLTLIWKQRPIIVTNIPIEVLDEVIGKYWSLFGTSAIAVHVQDQNYDKMWVGIYSHLPFSPEEGGQVVRIASWTPYRGLVTAPKNKIFPTKSESDRISVKEALKDPVTLNKLLMNPRTFRFEKPVTLKVAAEHWPTHVIVRESTSGTEQYEVAGSMGALLDAITQSLNVTYKLIRPEDGQWGSPNPDGSWTGMVGLVHRQVADMALGPHDITLVRSKIIDYSSTLFTDARQFVLAQNRAEVDPWGFLLPLAPTVWAGVVLALLVIAAITMMIGTNYRGDPAHTYAFAVVFHTYRLFLNQGLTMRLQKTSERLIVLSWLIGAMIICWSYSTNLMSLLAVRHAPRPVQSIEDLLQEKSLAVIFPRKTALSDYVLSQKAGQLKDVADLRHVGRYKDLHYNDFANALETLVRHGDHALATCTTDAVNIIAKYFSKKGSCNFYIARETFVPFMLALVIQKGSPLVEAISHRVQGVVSGGLYRYWLDSNLPNSTSCKHMPSSFTVREPLAMSNIWGMFVLLASGMMLAVMIFLLEVFFGRYPDADLPDMTSSGAFHDKLAL